MAGNMSRRILGKDVGFTVFYRISLNNKRRRTTEVLLLTTLDRGRKLLQKQKKIRNPRLRPKSAQTRSVRFEYGFLD